MSANRVFGQVKLRITSGINIARRGVLEEMCLTYPETGTPQGGVISPLLANIYLHYVLDAWLEQVVKPHLVGRVFLIRYADDFVLGFTCEQDARRVLEVLPRRFAKYGLTIHPDKTRLLRFRPGPVGRQVRDSPPPGTFDFLGFTHYWARSRKGHWVVKRKTGTHRFTRAIKKIAEWCRFNLHTPLSDQHATLSSKLRGHFQYYGITGNSHALSAFRHFVTRVWKQWLSRRNRERTWTWVDHNRMLQRYPLPPAIAVHSTSRP